MVDGMMVIPTKRTYSFGVEEFLHEWYAVCGSLAAPCWGAREDVAIFEGEGDRLLLYSGRARKPEVCEGTEDKRGEEIRKRCECLEHGLLRLRLGLRLSHLRSSDNNSLQIPTANGKVCARDTLFPLTWEHLCSRPCAPLNYSPECTVWRCCQGTEKIICQLVQDCQRQG
jgi:hypothetical protein